MQTTTSGEAATETEPAEERTGTLRDMGHGGWGFGPPPAPKPRGGGGACAFCLAMVADCQCSFQP